MESVTAWRRSTKCASNACVEVAHMGSRWVLIRDSTATAVLVIDRKAWAAFIAEVKA